MNKRKIAMGPGAASIILIIVTLSLCMLAMLSLISARNDANLSKRSANMIEQVYTLSSQSERSMARLDAVLVKCLKENPADEESYWELISKNIPEGMELDEGYVYWTEPLENRILECIAEIMPPDSKQRLKWAGHRLIVEEPEDDW